MVERFNRTLVSMIKSYIKGKQTDWDLNLGCLAMAYRCTPQESTNFSPNFIMLGRELKLPLEILFCPKEDDDNSSYGEYINNLRDNLYEAHIIVRRKLQTAAKVQKDRYDTKMFLNLYRLGDLLLMLHE